MDTTPHNTDTQQTAVSQQNAGLFSLFHQDKLVSSWDTLKAAWRIYAVYWKKFVKLIFLIIAFAAVPLAGAFIVYAGMSYFYGGHDPQPVFATVITIFLAVFAVIVVMLGLIYYGFSFEILATQLEEQSPVKSTVQIVRHKLHSLVWIHSLTGIIVFAGSFLLIVPGIVFFIYYFVSGYVFLVEGVKGYGALKRSREIVKGYGWAVARRSVLWVYVTFLLYFISTLISNFIPLVDALVGTIVGPFILTPLGALFSLGIFYNLRDLKTRGRATDGYTVIQKIVTLLSVVPLIGAIGWMGVTGYREGQLAARNVERVSNILKIRSAIETYAEKSGRKAYPLAEEAQEVIKPLLIAAPPLPRDAYCYYYNEARNAYVVAAIGMEEGELEVPPQGAVRDSATVLDGSEAYTLVNNLDMSAEPDSDCPAGTKEYPLNCKDQTVYCLSSNNEP